MSCGESNSGSGKSHYFNSFSQKPISASAQSNNQFQHSIEDTTIIVAATVPSLRALFTRSHSKADRQTSPYVSNQSKDRRWNNVWNKKKTSLRMDTSVSDQIELTSANNRNFGVGPSTSYIVNVNGGKVGESFDNPPERGIMKTSTMNAYSEEA